MTVKKSLAELLSSFARRIDNRNEQDGIRGYLRILKDLTGTDIIYVAQVSGQQASVQVGLNGDENFDELVYDLKDTPCDIASAGRVCTHSPDVQEKFPKDELLVEMNINGYMGVPLFNLGGTIDGIIVGLNHHKNPYTDDDILLYQMVSQLIQVEYRNLLESKLSPQQFESINLNNISNLGQFFYSVLENLPGNISVINKNDTFVYINKSYADFIGLSPSEIIGKNITELFPPEILPEHRSTDQIVLDIGEKYSYPHEVKTPGYPHMYFNVTKFPFKDQSGDIFAIGMISIDVTDNKIAKRKLREEKLKNIQSSKLATVGEMTAGMTHELGNPLTIIQGLTEKLSIVVNREFDVEDIQKDIAKIQSASERMGRLISSLRVFSRDDSKSNFEKINLKEMIDITLDLVTHRFEKDGIQFSAPIIDGDYKVNAQTVLLSQVLVNLLINSVDAISELKEKWIKIEFSEDANKYNLRIIDSGSGIPEDTVEKMFNSFYTTKELGRGTGLGLSLCLEIIEQHQAELLYELYNGNTSFLIKLPKA